MVDCTGSEEEKIIIGQFLSSIVCTVDCRGGGGGEAVL